MKLLRWLMVVAVTVTGFTACQKELDGDGIATGSFKKDGAGNCSPVTVNGIYRVDSLMKADNFVDVQVNAITEGTFDIKSDTISGLSFSKSGSMGTGLNTIRLFASGKPLTAGTHTFTITFGASVCTFDITVFGATAGAAIYTLDGSPGNCTGFTVNGTYTAGIPLDASNWVNFSVNVTTIGTYNLSTTTTNGITFSGTGVFTTTGTQGLTLLASGTPVAGGTFTFTPSNAGTNCSYDITVLPAGSGTAVYSLEGNPGNCSGAVSNGTYTVGTATTGTNTVTLKVNVTTAGSYSISSNTQNGISFSKTGTFASTGVQNVLLNATGTPAAAGTFNFTATAPGTPPTNCTFSVTCSGTTPPPPVNLDYLPQTPHSNWSARLVGGTPTDTTYIKASTDTKTFSGQAYRIFENLNMGTPTDSIYQRKAVNSYYQFLDGTFGILDNPINKEVKLLDSSLNVGATWTDNLGSNSSGGIPLTAKITAEILEKGASAVIAGNSYTQVIKVKYTYIGNIGLGDIVVAEEVRWYAKGFGLIYDKFDNLQLSTTQEFETTRIAIF